MRRGRRSGFTLGLVSGGLMTIYSLRRSPSVLLWYIGFPLLLLVIAKYIFLGGGGAPVVGVYPEGSPAYKVLQSMGVKVEEYGSLGELFEDLSRGFIVVAVIEENGEVRVLYHGEEYSLLARGVAEAVAASRLAGSPGAGEDLRSLESLLFRAAGVHVEPFKDNAGPGRALAEYSVNLVGVESLYIALYGGMVMLIAMRREGMLDLVATSPGGPRSLLGFMTGMNLTASLVTTLAILTASIALGADYSGVSPAGVLAGAFLILAGLETIFLASIPLSLLVKAEETAAALAGIAGFLLIFSTGLAVPREMLPGLLAEASLYFPLTLAVELGKDAIFASATPAEVLAEAWPLYLSLALAGLVGVLSYRRVMALAVEE
ncbi:ABC transporter, permease protein [Aeropyrum pernix]|uniref:ABC transporter, permease protein n=1 Tax=Aeropyrum pernix TaxID=56636 RepID=A0A401H9J3_AERPX|nr:ABC transporter permease [Aeropyrum pernix]GBF09125.1 ABC transporter, permease protein [Aeropyrum pernix]